MPKQSLTDRIRKAESVREIQALLNEGANYTEASDKTRRSWMKLAARRDAELTA